MLVLYISLTPMHLFMLSDIIPLGETKYSTFDIQFRRYVAFTHFLLHKMAAISQTILSDSFSWMESFVFWLKVLMKFVSTGSIGLDNALMSIRSEAII